MSTCTMGDSLETVATLCTCNLQITMRKPSLRCHVCYVETC